MSEMIDWVKDVSSECESVEVSELNTWFSELQTAYQQETNPSLAVRKQRLQALKNTANAISIGASGGNE